MTEGSEAFELLDGATVHALGLGLIAEEKSERGRGFEEALEAFGKEVVAILGLEDSIIVVDEVGAEADQRPAVGGNALIEADGKQAAMQAFDAKESLLGKGDALDGEELLGVDGLVGGDGVFAKIGDLVDLFETHDGKGGGGETRAYGSFGRSGFCPPGSEVQWRERHWRGWRRVAFRRRISWCQAWVLPL